MSEVKLVSAGVWTAHPSAAPRTESDDHGEYLTAANSTRTCYGGWQFEYDGVEPGRSYAVSVDARLGGVELPRDTLVCTAHWTRLPLDKVRAGYEPWDYLAPEATQSGGLSFGRVVEAPEGASSLTIRCSFRWATTGSAVWSAPRVVAAAAPVGPARPVRIAVVTGHARSRPSPVPGVQANLDFYGRLCEAACRAWQPDLIALPEIAVHWGLAGHALDLAVPVPGPETAVFADIARRHHARLVVGLYERDGDAAYNSAVLIAPDGSIDGRYRKVHLAVGGEIESGLRPGDSFPVFATEIGRVGCNICMDSSAAESSRMVGLNGAEVTVLPIMGDHRADRLTPGQPIYHEERWRAIMRTRALDNQYCLVVARNEAQGSCVVDARGDIVAWNEGDRDAIYAEVDLGLNRRFWNGASLRDVNWMQRRPHTYGAFVDAGCFGALRPPG